MQLCKRDFYGQMEKWQIQKKYTTLEQRNNRVKEIDQPKHSLVLTLTPRTTVTWCFLFIFLIAKLAKKQTLELLRLFKFQHSKNFHSF